MATQQQVLDSLRDSSSAYWTKSGAVFTRELAGQVWQTRVQSVGGVVTIAQAAKLLRVAPMTVHRWVEEGLLKPVTGRQMARTRVRGLSLSAVKRVAIEKGLFLAVLPRVQK
jgi:hypothetical protein